MMGRQGRGDSHLSRWFPTTTSFSSTMLGCRSCRSRVISRRLLMGIPAGSNSRTAPLPRAGAGDAPAPAPLLLRYHPSRCPSAPSSTPRSHLSGCPGPGLEEQQRSLTQYQKTNTGFAVSQQDPCTAAEPPLSLGAPDGTPPAPAGGAPTAGMQADGPQPLLLPRNRPCCRPGESGQRRTYTLCHRCPLRSDSASRTPSRSGIFPAGTKAPGHGRAGRPSELPPQPSQGQAAPPAARGLQLHPPAAQRPPYSQPAPARPEPGWPPAPGPPPAPQRAPGPPATRGP